VFENLRRCLAAAGATFDDVVKLTFFVTDVAHLPAVRRPATRRSTRSARRRVRRSRWPR